MKRYTVRIHGGLMMKRALFAICLSLVAALALGALPLTVSWADGRVDVMKGSSWAAVNIGDKLDSSSTLRLAAGASIELTSGNRKLSLTAPGSYALEALLAQGGDAGRRKSAVLDKLGKLVDPKATVSGSAVAAVRGAAVEPASESVTWMSDTVDVAAVMDEGRRLAREGSFAAAAAKFDEAVLAGEGDEKDAASYAEAWALAADDSSARAVKILRGMPSGGSWAGPRVLLLARLDIDSGARPEAKALLEAASASQLFVGDDVELARSLLAEASSK
jgi:hypothetical protein